MLSRKSRISVFTGLVIIACVVLLLQKTRRSGGDPLPTSEIHASSSSSELSNHKAPDSGSPQTRPHVTASANGIPDIGNSTEEQYSRLAILGALTDDPTVLTAGEKNRLIGAVQELLQIKGEFEAELAQVTSADARKVILTIPSYAAGENIRERLEARLREILPAALWERFHTKIMDTADQLFDDFGRFRQKIEVEHVELNGSDSDMLKITQSFYSDASSAHSEAPMKYYTSFYRAKNLANGKFSGILKIVQPRLFPAGP